MASILLVDDDKNLLAGLRRSLRQQPYTITTVNSAEMAIEMFKRGSFDVVVADQKMGGLSGTELITWLANVFPETVRIMLTGQPDVQVMKDAINNGKVFRFLTKPCKDLDLAFAIRDGLESRFQSAE